MAVEHAMFKFEGLKVNSHYDRQTDRQTDRMTTKVHSSRRPRSSAARPMNEISETGETTPTKNSLHAFQVNLYLHEFFELILFF